MRQLLLLLLLLLTLLVTKGITASWHPWYC
jgi:hypothetical protein